MKRVLTSLLFLALGFTGCINDANGPGSNIDPNQSSARMRIPVFPSGGAAKSGPVDTTLVGPFIPVYSAFELTITGAGMAPITRSYPAATFGGKVVEIDSIPAGPARTFTGRIIEGGQVTHEGQSMVDMAGGKVTDVTLVLRNTATGTADICIVVEDWANSNSCSAIDTVPHQPYSLDGMWQFHIGPQVWIMDKTVDPNIGLMPAYALDGRLSLNSNGKQISGDFYASDMSDYQVSGYAYQGGWRLTFKRSAGQPIPGPMPLVCIYDSLTSKCAPPQQPPLMEETLYVRVDSLLFDKAGNRTEFLGYTTDATWEKNLMPATGTPMPIDPPIIIDPPVYDTNYVLPNQPGIASGPIK